MKIIRLCLLGLVLLISPVCVVAQSVVITPKKTVYRRPKPIQDFKRTFTVRRPVAKASTAALSKKITAAISPERVLSLNIKEELGEYQWLEEADYKVLYNKGGLLALEQWMSGTAAYPDSVTKRVVVDTATGTTLTAANSFVRHPDLAKLIKAAQRKEIERSIREIERDPANDTPDAAPLFADANFTAADIKHFSVKDNGVTFYYDYGFPHVLTALQPTGEFFFTWAQLKPFIKPGGLLARFLR